jgi:hypothetical protein
MALYGICGLLAEEANFLAKVKVEALPDGFVPGYSLEDAVIQIRQQHTNYEALLDELQSLCAGRAKCPFSRNLASGLSHERCPYFVILRRSLTSTADERAEAAFTEWCKQRNGKHDD